MILPDKFTMITFKGNIKREPLFNLKNKYICRYEWFPKAVFVYASN